MRRITLVGLVICLALFGTHFPGQSSAGAQGSAAVSAPRNLRVVGKAEAPQVSGPGNEYFDRLKRRPDVFKVPECLSTVPEDNGACSLRNNTQLRQLQFAPSVHQSLFYNFNWKDPLCYARSGMCGSVSGGITDGARLTYWPDSKPTCTAGQRPPAVDCIPPPCVKPSLDSLFEECTQNRDGQTGPPGSGVGAPFCYSTPAADAPPYCHDGHPTNARAFASGSPAYGQRQRFTMGDITTGSLLMIGDIRFSCSWLTPDAVGGERIEDARGQRGIKFFAYTGLPGRNSLYDQNLHLTRDSMGPTPFDKSTHAFRAGYDHYSTHPSIDQTHYPSTRHYGEIGYANVYDVPCAKWIRLYHLIEMQGGRFHEAFKLGGTVFPAGNYMKNTTYIADEDRDPILLAEWGSAIDTLQYFHFMTVTSSARHTWTNGDLHTDFRNFVWIRNPPANWTQAVSGIGLERPVSVPLVR